MIEELGNKIRHRIVTVTLNPVFDRTLWVKNFKPGGTFLADEVKIFAGGKGVNVSRSLKNFDIDSTATGILPEDGASSYIRALEAEYIKHDFLITSGTVRTNTTIISSQGYETHLREKGPQIEVTAFVSFKEKLLNLIRGTTAVVFAGRLPKGLEPETYFELVTFVKKHGCLVFLDVSGTALKNALRAKPFYIKPNLYEVKDALGYLPMKEDSFIRAVGDFHNMGIKHVLISRGKEGIVYSDGKEIVAARLVISNPINTVGSGDAVVAGSLMGILGGLDNRKIAPLACAFGGANTLVSGGGRFRPSDVIRLFEKVKLSSLA